MFTTLPNARFSKFRNPASGRSARKQHRSFWGYSLLLIAFLWQTAAEVNAQITPNFYKGGGTGTNVFPFNTSSVKRSQHMYLAGDLPGATSGLISRIYFRAATTLGPGTYSDFKVSMTQTTATVFPGAGSLDFFTGLTPVIVATSYTIPAVTTDAWFPLDFQTPFLFDANMTLVIEVEMSDKTSASGISVRTTSAPTAPNHKRLTATNLTATSGSASTVWSDFGIDVGPSFPCTAPPTPGQAVASASTACPGSNFTLTVTGNSTGTGQTYQWQSSTNGGIYTDIPSGTTATFITNQAVTNFYRVKITCSGQTSISAPVQVTTNTTSVNGTFTINKNLPASATNFTSFASAITGIACGGVNGPVVFNVDSAAGPYSDNVVIPDVPGVSAINTITINGNGAVLNGATGSAVLMLNGTDYLRVNNLTMNIASGTTGGQTVHLTNGADYNVFSGNTIAHSTSTTSTSYAVSINGGNNSNNTFQNNTIIGGYYGIYNYGAAAAIQDNNRFLNNIVRDQYIYPIYNYYNSNTVIEGNNISRATRTAVSSFYGITLSTGSTGAQVSKNRIHNSHDAASSLTGLVYGLYVTGADAVASPNVFSNNLVYNINNTGTLYGIYTTGSDGSHFFHNTINLDNTSNTGTVRGFYQTTAATDVKFINNIVTINAGPTGTKHAIYFGTATSVITSNNNVLRMVGGSAASGLGYIGSNQPTLANWQTASVQDAASVSADPMYSSPATGDFTPTNPTVNNIGQGVGIATDITGLTRNPNMPDAGAYEFLNNPNDVGITAILSPNSVCGLSASESITIVLTNFGTNAQNNITISYTLNGGTPVTQTVSGPLNPGGRDTITFNVPVNLSAAGGYTIVASSSLAGDTDASNNSTTKIVTNAFFPGLPIYLDFETPATGVAAMKTVTKANSTITEAPGASNGPGSTKGMVMAGITNPGWAAAFGTANPWLVNPEHLAGAYICFSPAGGAPGDSLWLTFDLRQLFKTANAHTNFRITVNGLQQGPTYRPPFAGSGQWQKVKVDLTNYKNDPSVEIGFESSVAEEYANGTGPANLVDNIRVVRRIVSGRTDDFLQQNLTVYPNPSAGLFNLNLPKGNSFTIEVSDLTGKVIKTQIGKAGNNPLNLEGTAKGIYLLKVASKEGVAVRKLVVE